MESRRQREVGVAEYEHRRSDVLGEHLTLQQGPIRVVLAKTVFVDAVDRSTLGAPTASENTGPANNAIGVDSVHTYAVLAQLGGEQPHLVSLIRFGRSIRDVVRTSEDRVLADDVDNVAPIPWRTITLVAARLTRNDPRAMTECCRSSPRQSCQGGSSRSKAPRC